MNAARSSVNKATPRGAVLLEIVLALGLFVATSLTLLGVVSSAIDSLSRSRDRAIGGEHARNALAMIEAGLARPETLSGPVAPWSGGDDDGSGIAASGDGLPFGGPAESRPSEAFNPGTEADFSEQMLGVPPGAPGDTGWALEIETEPARVPGLTLVIVRAYRVDSAGDELPGGASVTLRQIIALDGVSESDGGFPDSDPAFETGFDRDAGFSSGQFGTGGAP